MLRHWLGSNQSVDLRPNTQMHPSGRKVSLNLSMPFRPCPAPRFYQPQVYKYLCSCPRLRFAAGLVRFPGQLQEKLLEFLSLAHEESVGNEAIDSSRGIKLTRTGWTDDGAFGQTFDEVRWLRHDQVCL